MLEVTPPARRASQASAAAVAEKIARVVDELPEIQLLNVPEVIEENHAGAPFYKNADAREFACLLQSSAGRPAAVNKVTVHLSSKNELDSWLKQTLEEFGLRNVVFVGGNSGLRKYSGPSVIEANLRAFAFKELRVGNVCIPTRRNEAERLFLKTVSGCSFFTTQILLEAESVKSVLADYARECERRGVEPSEFFLSFAPVSSALDLDFFKWLGAFVPQGVEAQLKREGERMAGASIELSAGVFGEILRFAEEERLGVPLSLNVESISAGNLELAKRMAATLAPLLEGVQCSESAALPAKP